jgi:hypothetical protein
MAAASCIQDNGPHGSDSLGNSIKFNSKSVPGGNGLSGTLQIANISVLFLNGGVALWGEGERKALNILRIRRILRVFDVEL